MQLSAMPITFRLVKLAIPSIAVSFAEIHTEKANANIFPIEAVLAVHL